MTKAQELAETGELEAALSFYQRALQLDANYTPAMDAAAEVLLQQNEGEQALRDHFADAVLLREQAYDEAKHVALRNVPQRQVEHVVLQNTEGGEPVLTPLVVFVRVLCRP